MGKNLIKNAALAKEGRQKIEWVQRNMPLLNLLKDEFIKEQPFKGLRIALSIHLEAKTAYLAEVLAYGGAEVAVTGSNPLSTKDDVVAALAEGPCHVYAWYNATDEEYKHHISTTLDIKPHLIIDDGGDLVHMINTQKKDLIPEIIGGCEETTTGVIRLKAMAKEGMLQFPMIAVNDAYCKYLFDNRYGTGQSSWDAINSTTNLIASGKTAVIIGYGWCGKGLAMRAKGLGAKVIVCEIDPVKSIEALMDGFEVMPMIEAAKVGDIFITVTGCNRVVHQEHFPLMKDGAILANAGHFDVEVCIPELRNLAINEKEMRKNIRGFEMADGRWIYLLAEGRLVNLAAGDGHPAEIMDLSFALQALSAKYLVENHLQLATKVYTVPQEIDNRVASLKLQSLGISIDKLTPEQKKYLQSWQV